jgi:formylmethanofuran dehydrogenase subunit B
VSGAARIEENATCLGCGCACDDINVVIDAGRISEARNACALGLRWFGDGSLPGAVLGGRTAAIEDVVAEIATVLRGARAPLVFLAPDLTTEAQRAAIAVADQLRAFVDSATSSTAFQGILAAQRRGRTSATFGEIRNRADVIVFWAVDPALSYPRFQSRYAPDPVGVYLPNGRRDRTVIAVDVGANRGPDDADLRIQMTAAEEAPFLASLRASLAGRTIGDAPLVARVNELATRLNRAKYAMVVTDVETPPEAPNGRLDSLIALTHSLRSRHRAHLADRIPDGRRLLSRSSALRS